MNEALAAKLKYLHLGELLTHWDDYLKLAGDQRFSHGRLLTHIVEELYRVKRERLRELRLRKAHIPEPWVIETFPFDRQPKLNDVRSQVITGNGIHDNYGRAEKVPGGKVKGKEGWVNYGRLRKDEQLRIRKRVQVIIEVEVEAGTYASEQYQSRVNAPSMCPNCGIAQSLEAHGYYWRWVTEVLCGRVLRMAVRRFFVGAAQ